MIAPITSTRGTEANREGRARAEDRKKPEDRGDGGHEDSDSGLGTGIVWLVDRWGFPERLVPPREVQCRLRRRVSSGTSLGTASVSLPGQVRPREVQCRVRRRVSSGTSLGCLVGRRGILLGQALPREIQDRLSGEDGADDDQRHRYCSRRRNDPACRIC